MLISNYKHYNRFSSAIIQQLSMLNADIQLEVFEMQI